MSKLLLIDYERCNGCEICALHCSFVKTGTFNPSRSRIQIIGWEERGLFIPSVCLHCEEPPCIPACPEAAIDKDNETGKVYIDNDKCTGRLACLSACPYHTLTVDPVENKVIICDLCHGDPVCARVCPVGAIQLIETDKLKPAEWQQHTLKLADILSSMPGLKESRK